VAVPASTDITLSVIADTYFPSLNFVVVGDVDFALETDIVQSSAARPVIGLAGGDAADESVGHVLAGGSVPEDETQDLAGLVMFLEPANGTITYFSESMLPDPELTETSSLGAVAAVNLPPGDYTLRFDHESIRCDGADSGWPTGQDNEAAFEVRGGFLSAVRLLNCQ
jgi:hypothetical protein